MRWLIGVLSSLSSSMLVLLSLAAWVLAEGVLKLRALRRGEVDQDGLE